MAARLVPLNPRTTSPIAVQRPVLLVGRHPDCDVRIDQPTISRRHCCLALAYDRLLIRDLGSRNGVRLNGRVINESQLFPGDEVAIGPLVFRVEDPDAAAVAAAPARATAPTPSPVDFAPKSPGLPDLPRDIRTLGDDLIPLDF